MKPRKHVLSKSQLYEVCYRVIRQRESMPKVAKWLSDILPTEVLGNDIYSLIKQGMKEGLVQLCPLHCTEIASTIASRADCSPGRLQVLDVLPNQANQAVAAETAEIALHHALELQRAGKEEIHIGFASGRMSTRVARHLARRYRQHPQKQPDNLWLHALTAGFDSQRLETNPVAFFTRFQRLRHPVRFVALSAPPVVPANLLPALWNLPALVEARQAAEQLDIVITSIGDRHDPCVVFNNESLFRSEARRQLVTKGWIGDVQWQPFSIEGEIDEPDDFRVFRVLDFKKLISMAREKDKMVIMAAAPCVTKGCKDRTDPDHPRPMTRHRALRPLLLHPNLRAFTKLVMDVTTAENLLSVM